MKKRTRKHIVPILLSAVVLLVLVGGQSVSRAISDLGTVINNYAENGIVLPGAKETAKEVFGAAGSRFPNGIGVGTTSTPEVAGDLDVAKDINLKSASTTTFVGTGGLLFSNLWGRTSTGGGVREGWAHKDCTSGTSTLFSIENTTGKTFYVTDVRILLTGVATATTQFFVGTSTVSFVNEDTFAAVTDPSNRTIQSIMGGMNFSANTFPNATNSVLSLADSPHSAARGLYSTNTIPVLAGEFITGYASSTWSNEDVGGYTKSLLNCEAHIEFMMFN